MSLRRSPAWDLWGLVPNPLDGRSRPDVGRREPTGATARRVAAVRWLLVGYLVWKLASFPWPVLAAWPVRSTSAYAPLVPPWILSAAPFGAIATACALVAFAVGYRPRLAALLGVVGLCHLGVAVSLVSASGWTKSLFLAALVVAVLGVCDDRRRHGRSVRADRADGDARGDTDAADRAGHPRSRSTSTTRLPLQFTLLAVAALYFGSGVGKVVDGPLLAWTTARSMGSYLLYGGVVFTPGSVLPVSEPLVALLLASPILLAAIAWATILLELGFLPAVIARLPVWPFVVGFAGMHVAVAVTMGPFFVDQLVFLALVVDHDRLIALASRAGAGIVGDADADGTVTDGSGSAAGADGAGPGAGTEGTSD